MKEKRKKMRTVQDCLREKILFGGEILTRAEVYQAVIKDGHSWQCANYFAFKPEAIENE